MCEKVIIFLALVSLGLGTEEDLRFHADQWLQRKFSPQSKVVGGTDAKIGEFPYQVSLRFGGRWWNDHFCGGAILSEKVVLTAGHCVKYSLLPPGAYIEAVAGKHETRTDGPNVQASRIKKIICHPKYSGDVNPYDIAVLILETPFIFNKFVKPIALPEPGATFTGKATLSGWGSTSKIVIPIPPKVLQKATLPLIDYEECEQKLETTSMEKFSNICTGPIDSNLSACSGDSGGPLAKDVNGTITIIGIVSWGIIPCGVGYPTVYTKVSSFIDFIDSNSK